MYVTYKHYTTFDEKFPRWQIFLFAFAFYARHHRFFHCHQCKGGDVWNGRSSDREGDEAKSVDSRTNLSTKVCGIICIICGWKNVKIFKSVYGKISMSISKHFPSSVVLVLLFFGVIYIKYILSYPYTQPLMPCVVFAYLYI